MVRSDTGWGGASPCGWGTARVGLGAGTHATPAAATFAHQGHGLNGWGCICSSDDPHELVAVTALGAKAVGPNDSLEAPR